MSGNKRRDCRKRTFYEGKELKTRRNIQVVSGNGLCGSAHPRTDSCAVRGWGMVIGVLRQMRSVGPMHASHDEEEHQNKNDGKTFSIGHGI